MAKVRPSLTLAVVLGLGIVFLPATDLIAGVVTAKSKAGQADQAHREGVDSQTAKSQSSRVVNSGNPKDRHGNPTIALTFDDGPHPVHTPRLLDMLRKAGVRATFYVLGSLVAKHPDIIDRMVREGHEIGNHTWSHPDLRRLGDREIRRELQKTEDAVLAVTGRRTFSMRPPYGAINPRVIASIPESHRPVVLWTVDPLDWRKPGAGVVAKRLVSGSTPGAILLCHDIHQETIDAIGIALPELTKKGYTFSTVSEMLTQTQVLDLDFDP